MAHQTNNYLDSLSFSELFEMDKYIFGKLDNTTTTAKKDKWRKRLWAVREVMLTHMEVIDNDINTNKNEIKEKTRS